MSKNNIINARMQQKHEIEENWLKSSLIPLQGEIIVYDPDETNTSSRVKVGNGIDNVNDLPFLSGSAAEDALKNIYINDSDAYVNVGVHNISSGFVGVRIRQLVKDENGKITISVDNQDFITKNFAGQEACIFINNQRNYVNVLTIPSLTTWELSDTTIPDSVFEHFNSATHSRPAWLYFANKELNESLTVGEKIEFSYLQITFTPAISKDLHISSGREWIIPAGTSYEMLELIDGAEQDVIIEQIKQQLPNVDYEVANETINSLSFTTTEITRESNIDKLISAEDNILSKGTVFSPNGNTNVLTDGINCVTTTDVNTKYWWQPTVSYTTDQKYFYVTYVFTQDYAITNFMLVGSGVTPYGVEAFDVYVGKTYLQVVSDNISPNYSYNSNVVFGLKMNLVDPVITNTITFRMKARHNTNVWQIWVSELAAKGTPVSITVTDITDGANEDRIISHEDNLLATASVAVYENASGDKFNIASLYDGKLCGITEGVSWSNPVTNIGTMGKGKGAGVPIYVCYDLGKTYKIDGLLIAGAGTGNYGLTTTKIYVGNNTYQSIKSNTAIQPVYETEDNIVYGRHISLDTPVVGRYVIFAITGTTSMTGSNANQIWISELGASGSLDDKDTFKYTAIGDSITGGYLFNGSKDSITSINNSYANLLAAGLKTIIDKPLDYTNIGDKGKTVKTWYDNNKNKISYTDVLTVMLGTNDSGTSNWTTETSQAFKSNYLTIINAYKAINSKVNVYLISPTACADWENNSLLRNSNIESNIIPILKTIAEEINATFIDVFHISKNSMQDAYGRPFIDEREIAADSYIHPGEQGHKILYEAISPYVISRVQEYGINSTDGHPGVLSYITGYRNTNPGYRSLALGGRNIVNSDASFVAGYQNRALGYMSASFGRDNDIRGAFDFVAGTNNKTYGTQDFSNGSVPQNRFIVGTWNQVPNTASKVYMLGGGLLATHSNQIIVGKYNENVNAAFIVGIGDSDTNRKNGLVVNRDGSVTVAKQGISDNSVVRYDTLNNAINNINLNGYIKNGTSELKLYTQENHNILSAGDVGGGYSGLQMSIAKPTQGTGIQIMSSDAGQFVNINSNNGLINLNCIKAFYNYNEIATTNITNALSNRIDTLTSAGLTRQIVSSISEITEPNDSTIYMVGPNPSNNYNSYTEVMFIDGTLEIIGSTAIDLSGYLKANGWQTTTSGSKTILAANNNEILSTYTSGSVYLKAPSTAPMHIDAGAIYVGSSTSGGTDLIVSGKVTTNGKELTSPNDLTTKKYVDDNFIQANGWSTSSNEDGSISIKADGKDVISYIDNTVASLLYIQSPTGDITIASRTHFSNKVTMDYNVSFEDGNQVVTKDYVDTAINSLRTELKAYIDETLLGGTW